MEMDKKDAAEMLQAAIAAIGPDGVKHMLGVAVKPADDEKRLRPSEPIALYAQEDVMAADGKTVVHPKGYRQLVPPVDAREIMRGGLYAKEPPLFWTATAPELPAAMAAAATLPPHPQATAGRTALVAALTQPVTPPAPASFTLTVLPGVNEALARKLEDAGFGTADAIRAAKPEELAAVPGMGAKMAQRAQEFVAEHYPAPAPTASKK